MTDASRSPKATTAAKGRPTPARTEFARRRSDRLITLQWVGVGLVVAAMLVLAVIVSRGQEPVPLHQR